MPIYTIQAPSGHEVDIDAPDEATAVKGAQDWYAQNVSNKTDTSIQGAITQGASDIVRGVGKTVKNYVSKDAGKVIEGFDSAKGNPKYKSATEGFIRPEDGAGNHMLGLDWSKLPRAALEQAPGLGVDVVGQLLSKRFGPIGQYLAGTLTYGARTMGGEAEKRAAARTGDPNADPSFDDKLTGAQSTLVQSALNKMGTNAIVNPSKVVGTGVKGAAQAAGNVGKATLAEGATNAAQDLVSQGFATKGTSIPFDLQSVKGSAVLGGVGGGVFAAPRSARDALTSSRFRDQFNDVHTEMAANRIREKAAGADLNDQSKAFEATDAAVSDVRKELGSVASSIRSPSTEAANALQRAKDGNVLTDRELTSIDAEGNETLSSLVRQASALEKLKSKGNFDTSEKRFAGGASEVARKNARGALIATTGAASLPHVAAQGSVGLDTMAGTLPSVAGGLAAAYGAYRGMKIVDRGLGLSSPARTFTDRFAGDSGIVRPDVQLNENPTGPKVVPQNSLSTPQPWGPIPDKPQKFKPDILEPGIAKIVEKLQKQKQQQTAREAMPLLRQLAETAKPPTPPDADTRLQDAIKGGKQVVKDRTWADNMRQQYEAEQASAAPQDAPQFKMEDVFKATQKLAKGLQTMANLRQQGLGSNRAEAEAAVSPMILEQGGLGEVRNPAMGKRANELISVANALKKLRAVPETDSTDAPKQPEQPQTPRPDPNAAEQFVLPESPHVFKQPREAAEAIYRDAVAGGKEVRHAEGFKAATTRRLTGEESIYMEISNSMPTVAERGAFHKYLAALWGSDSPEVVVKVREHMLAEFPQHAQTIQKHLSDEAIKGLWTKSKKK
jgi:hypothetical protein